MEKFPKFHNTKPENISQELLAKFRTALANTKFKSKLPKMYYYGTVKQAKKFILALQSALPVDE